MSVGCTMSQFPVPFASTMAPYLEPQYAHAPMIASHSRQEMSRMSPQRNIPPSPASSTSDFKVSKAKKGKRVHACEFPGCSKIFTRAEHRRRHELSHKSKKTYTCNFEGCTKAFHRADYLTQHMARHDPDHIVSKSPSLRSNSTSSAVSSAPSQSYTKSPVIAGFHSPVPSTSSRTPTNADQSVVMCSNCYNCQNGAHAPNSQSAPLYNYSPSSSMGYFGPQSPPAGVNPGLEAVIDQYMRSVLRPEAFLPVHSQDQISSPFWNSNIDPNLPTMSSSNFSNPTSYPWPATTGAPSMSPHIPSVHSILGGSSRRESEP